MKSKLGSLTAILLLFVAGAPPQLLAQERVITGRVTDAQTSAPIANPKITVKGTRIGTVGGSDGTFVLRGVPAGPATLVVERIGNKTKEVAVAADQTTVQVALETDFLKLDELVVTGRATSVRRQNLANAIATVSGEEIARVPANDVESALQGKVAGATISANSGAPGGGLQVNLRGVTSINAVSEPLYVIDGVIVSNVAIPSNLNAISKASGGSNPSLTQDNQVNRIADLNPDEIENIEILKGASASTIYGSKASNGVVIITTKRGSAGKPKIRLTARGGLFALSNKLGSRVFTNQADAIAAFGSRVGSQFKQGQVFDFEQQLAGRKHASFDNFGSVSGGNDQTTYFGSLGARDDEGIVTNTGFERQSGRVNIGQKLGERADLDLGVNITHTIASRGEFNNDNAGVNAFLVLPFTPNFIPLVDAQGNFLRNQAVANGSNPLQTAALLQNEENVWRYASSGNLEIRLVDTDRQSFKFVGNGGVDFFTQRNRIFSPPEIFFESADGLDGTSLLSNSTNLNVNGNFNLIHHYAPESGAFSTTTSAGIQFEKRDLETSRIVSQNLIAGQPSVAAGTQISVNQLRQKTKDFGFYFQEELLTFNDRLLITGAIRADRSSANGDNETLFAFPKAAGSYRIPDIHAGPLSELKLRVAFGESGNLPLFGNKFTLLNGTNNIQGIPATGIEGTAGSNNIKPERSKEIEGGFDAVLFGGRGQLEFTAYEQRISDLILQRRLAPSTGFNTQTLNAGLLRTRGFEIGLNLTPIASKDLTWNWRTTFALNRSKIVELPVAPFLAGGFGVSLGAFKIEQGESATRIIGNDPNAPGGTRNVGDANPDFVLGFTQDLTYKKFHLTGVGEWRAGGDIINLAEFLFDAGNNSVDFVPPGGTVRTGDVCGQDCFGQERLQAFGTFTQTLVQSGTFFKLRELNLSYELPKSMFAGLLGANNTVRITASGRNLVTFTPYRGLDPEVSNFGNQQIGRNIDVGPFPPSRSFWFSMDIGF